MTAASGFMIGGTAISAIGGLLLWRGYVRDKKCRSAGLDPDVWMSGCGWNWPGIFGTVLALIGKK